MIKYKKEISNILIDAFSCRHVLFSKLGTQILGFDHINELYNQIMNFLPFLVVANLSHRKVTMSLRGIPLKKENFIFLKNHIGNSLLKRYERDLMGHFKVGRT